MLTDESDILDGHIAPHYEALHTQGKDYIVREIVGLLKENGILK